MARQHSTHVWVSWKGTESVRVLQQLFETSQCICESTECRESETLKTCSDRESMLVENSLLPQKPTQVAASHNFEIYVSMFFLLSECSVSNVTRSTLHVHVPSYGLAPPAPGLKRPKEG